MRIVSPLAWRSGLRRRSSRSTCPIRVSSPSSSRRGQEPDLARRTCGRQRAALRQTRDDDAEVPVPKFGDSRKVDDTGPFDLGQRDIGLFPSVQVPGRHRADKRDIGLVVFVEHHAKLGQAVAVPDVYARQRQPAAERQMGPGDGP